MSRHQPTWAPDPAETEVPSAARMYDYYLGGSCNFAADRALAEQYIAKLPEIRAISWANRRFLRRAVAFLAGQGIDQFLDLGSGMPTVGNVHEVARALNPASRVIYADVDPVTVAHGTHLLAGLEGVAYLHADLRDTAGTLAAVRKDATLDLTRPVAVLMIAVMHFVPEEDGPASIIEDYLGAVAPGSYLAMSHATNDYQPAAMREAGGVYRKASHSMNFRSRQEIAQMLTGTDLVEPGLTDVIRWRPDPDDLDPYGGDVTRYHLLAAVGYRP